MGKIISSIWQTVDGVIDATTMDKWFMPFDSESRGNYINDTIHNCEAMLYGRLTYEMLSGYWSQQKNNEFGIADKLNQTRKFLVSTTIKEANWGETVIFTKDIVNQIKKMKNQIHGNILMQGSISLVNLLLKENLVDELKLLIHPYICGNGQKLFNQSPASALNIPLTISEHKAIDNGVVLLIYKI